MPRPSSAFARKQMFEIARRLGLTSCRAFTEWNSIEPGPKHYALKPWDQFFDAAKANDVQTVITIYDPPAWVMPVGKHAGYQMFPCDLDAFRDLITTMSKRYLGKFWGWEWLNEITPGGTPDYVADYIKLCRAGVESARAVDPKLGSVLAGGLWPRGYRLDVLNAGVGKYIDALPIHYGNGNGVQEARGDLDSFGDPRVAVWENESSAFVIQWNSPGLDVVSEPVKSKWVMTQWTDELAAGCEKLIYFGGEGDAIGDSDYLLSDYSPLPVAATLAVFAAKTFHAEPVGVFSSADNGARFHLFSRDGKAVLVAESTGGGKRETTVECRRGFDPDHGSSGQRNGAAGSAWRGDIAALRCAGVHRRRGFGGAENVFGALDRRAVGRRTRRFERSDATSDAAQRQAGKHSSAAAKPLRPRTLRHGGGGYSRRVGGATAVEFRSQAGPKQDRVDPRHAARRQRRSKASRNR